MKKYDYLIVGAGLFGSVFAHEAVKCGKTCLVIDKRDHIGGNIYTEEIEGIQVHKYGAHIFHTSNKTVWDYVNHFAEFNHFVNSPIAVYKDELYNLPFNMNIFHQLWGVRTPAEAEAKIREQISKNAYYKPQESGGTGACSGGTGCIRKAHRRLHQKTVGKKKVQGTSCIYYQASSSSLYL